MASLIDELIDILEQEYSIYKELLPVALEKTQVIVKNDLTALQSITEEEQRSIDRIYSLEQKRDNVMAGIKTVLNRKSKDFTLKTLIDVLGKQPKEQKALSVLHDNLRSTIHTLVEVNDHNKSLINQSLEMIEFNMNFIQSAVMAPGNNTYTKKASRYDTQMRGTGMFDAKQ